MGQDSSVSSPLKKNLREHVSGEGLTRGLLAMLAAGAVIGIALVFPGVGVLYREITREKWNRLKKRGVLKATVKRLERQKWISWREENGDIVLTLTEEGKRKILQYNIDTLKLKRQKKWDGMWRVIVFDIPNQKKVAREMLRRKLKEMDFFQLQESVFVTPFECKKEIDFLRHTFEIMPYVQYILAKEIPGLSVQLFKKVGGLPPDY